MRQHCCSGIHQRLQGDAVGVRKQKLEVLSLSQQAIDQVVLTDHCRSETFDRLLLLLWQVTQDFRQGREQQGDGGQPLLAVDHQLGGLHGNGAEALIDVHHRADEVNTDLIGGSSAGDVSPELLAFLQRP